MRVLDLDLDLFCSAPCALAAPGCRPGPEEAEPWEADRFRGFLESCCGLTRSDPIPGRVFETHDSALELWREHASVPLDVVHCDMHSDLGIGRPGPAFVLESVITRPVGDRVRIAGYRSERKLDEANYLLFALAFRWIASLTNVRSPASLPDEPSFCTPGAIRLVSSVGRLIPSLDFREPAVPYRVLRDPEALRPEGRFELASLAVSPRYAPSSLDSLIDVFREYIREV